MNKIFTSILALACASMAYADGFHFIYDGKEIKTDTSIEVGYVMQVPAISLVAWEPSLEIVSSSDTQITLEGTCDDESLAPSFQDCTENCVPAPFKTTYTLDANTPKPRGIHRSATKLTDDTKDLVGVLTAYENGNPSNKIVLTINFSNRSAEEVGGVDNVAVNGEFVRLEGGNSLSYSVNGKEHLEVYSILGTRLVDRAISGHGSVDLNGLGRGVYIYRAGRISGKIVVK